MAKQKLTEAEFFRTYSDIIVEAETSQVDEGFWDSVKQGAGMVARGAASALGMTLPPPNTSIARNAPAAQSTTSAAEPENANPVASNPPAQQAQQPQGKFATANKAGIRGPANAATANPNFDPYEQAKSKVRQLQPQAGAKALPAKMVTSLQGDMQRLKMGDKDSGAFAADKILKFAAAGYDVSKLSPLWLASAKQGERFLTQSVYRQISKMLKEHGLTWAHLGLTVRLDESVGNGGVFISRR